MPADQGDDEGLQLRGGQAPAGRVLRAAAADQAMGDVVSQPPAFCGLAVARGQAVAGLVEKLSGQARGALSGAVAIAVTVANTAARSRRAGLHLPLQRIPEGRVDDRRVLPVEHPGHVADAPGIDRVAQDMVDVALADRGAALASTGRQRAQGGSQPQPVGLGLDLAERPEPAVEIDQRPDDLGVRPRDLQGPAIRRIPSTFTER